MSQYHETVGVTRAELTGDGVLQVGLATPQGPVTIAFPWVVWAELARYMTLVTWEIEEECQTPDGITPRVWDVWQDGDVALPLAEGE